MILSGWHIVTAQDITIDEQKLKSIQTVKEFDAYISACYQGKIIEGSDTLAPVLCLQSLLPFSRQKDFAQEILPVIYSLIGMAYGEERSDLAMTYFLDARHEAEVHGRSLEYALTCFEIALIQHKGRVFSMAEKNYRKALEVGKDSMSHRTLIGCYNGLAIIASQQGRFADELISCQKALTIARNHQDKDWIGILIKNVAEGYYFRENYDSSKLLFNESLAVLKKTGEHDARTGIYIYLSRIALKENKDPLSRTYLDSAMSLVNKGGLLSAYYNPMDHIYELYSQLYANQGNYKMAFDYARKYQEARRKKQDIIDGKRLVQLQSAYDYKQQELKSELLEKVNDANRAIIAQQATMKAVFVGIILILGGVSVYVYRAHRQRLQLMTELTTSNHIKDKLFTIISHDLRSPVASLTALVGMFKRSTLTKDDFTMIISRLDQQLHSTTGILENLLSWSKANLEGVQATPRHFSLGIVSNVVEQFAFEAHQKNITIASIIPDYLTVNADERHVEIIFRNLVHNALKFTPKGGSVSLTAERINEMIEIRISDTGVGMSPDEVANLFKPDKKSSHRGTNDEKGSGIGLFIVKELVSMNAGTIHVVSERRQGTTFSVRLPHA